MLTLQPSDNLRVATLQGVSSRTFHAPELGHGLSVPGLYEYHAKHSPDHPVFCYVNVESGVLYNITYSEVWGYIQSAAKLVQSRIANAKDCGSLPVDSSSAHARPVIAILAQSGTMPVPSNRTAN